MGAMGQGSVALRASRGSGHSLDRDGASGRLQGLLEKELVETRQALADANREVAALRARAREEMREREELLTLVSHELRTPVTVIAGYNRLLLSGQVGALNAEQERFLRESTKSCQRLSGFIGELLETAVGPASHPQIQVAESPIEPTITAVLSSLRPLLDERQLRVELRLAPTGLRARIDCARIEQVLTNLLSNAIKYGRPGGCVEISTARACVEGLHFIEVAVEDDGPGVHPRDRDRIFEPYVRVDPDGGASGLGLGLAICRQIVEAHGGAITAAARPEGGSRFVFTLPAAATHAMSDAYGAPAAVADSRVGQEG